MTEANKTQVGGDHYQKYGNLQHWDIVHHFDLDYFQGQITKYIMRWKDKNGLQDLKKAQHFLQKYIELSENQASTHDNGSHPGPGYVDQGKDHKHG